MTNAVRTVRLIAMSGALLAASFVAAAPATAAGCAVYGKLSLQQARENEQRGCGFTGPSWSTDLRAHIKWCASVGPDQWKEELQRRTKKLAECKN